MSSRLRSVATSLRTRLAVALALVMLVPVVAAAVVAGVVVPARARAAAQSTAVHDVSAAALALATRCQVIADSTTALARQVAQYASTNQALTIDQAQAAADRAVDGRSGLTAGVLDPKGKLLAFAGDPGGRPAVTVGGYGAACTQGSPGRRPELMALSESAPVSVRRGSTGQPVATVVLWQAIDQDVLDHLAASLGSDSRLSAGRGDATRASQGVADGHGYAVIPAGPGLPFALRASQPVPGSGLGPVLGVLILAGAGLLAILMTRVIAGRLVRPVVALTGTVDDLAGQLNAVTMELNDRTARLTYEISEHEKARQLSITDALTGVGNVRHLSAELSREVKRAIRYDQPLTVLMLDLDHFKQVNDTLGHQFGDAVLRDFAHRVRSILREVDIVARYGGEEFAVLLPETDVNGGSGAAERVIEAVRARPFGHDGVERAVTVSIGIASVPLHARSAADLLHSADQALYEAKSAGRDCWIVAPVSGDSAASVSQAG